MASLSARLFIGYIYTGSPGTEDIILLQLSSPELFTCFLPIVQLDMPPKNKESVLNRGGTLCASRLAVWTDRMTGLCSCVSGMSKAQAEMRRGKGTRISTFRLTRTVSRSLFPVPNPLDSDFVPLDRPVADNRTPALPYARSPRLIIFIYITDVNAAFNLLTAALLLSRPRVSPTGPGHAHPAPLWCMH